MRTLARFTGTVVMAAVLATSGLACSRSKNPLAYDDGSVLRAVRDHLVLLYEPTFYATLRKISTKDGAAKSVLDVSFPSYSIKAHDDYVDVRVAVVLDGAAPPDGKEVVYLELEPIPIVGGWRVRGTSNFVKHYLSF